MNAHEYPTFANASGRRFGAEEEAAVTRVLRSGHLWRVDGPETAALEREFAELFGMPHAVAAATGSGVIHCAIAALDLEPGDQIIVPPITDAGSVIGALAQGLVPVFADVDPITGCITPETVAAVATERTRAVVVVHLFGGAADVDGIVAWAAPRGVRVVEDCAQAYLTRTPAGALVGTIGDIGCFSLQQSKHISAGDGGLLITRDAELARRAALFADKGWPRDTGERTHPFLGLNYRMTELIAAVARVQLTRLEGVVADRRAVAAQFNAALARPGVYLPGPVAAHSYWLYPIVLDPEVCGFDAPMLADALTGSGLPVAAGYLQRVLYRNPVFTQQRTFGSSGWPLRDAGIDYDQALCPVAEDMVARTLLTVGINENFDAADVASAIDALTGALDALAAAAPGLGER